MLNLNLVSRELREAIKLRHIYKAIRQVNYILMIITVFVAIVMLAAKIILQNNFNKIVEETTLIVRSNQGRNARIGEIDRRLFFSEGIQNDFIPWSFLFKDLGSYTNDDINFYSIKIDWDNKAMVLRGRAKTRVGLLALKVGIEKSDIFSAIDFPMKNILEKENVDFEIKTSLNLDNIKED